MAMLETIKNLGSDPNITASQCMKHNAEISGGTAESDCLAIDRTICHNAACHAPKRNCCAAYLGCEGFETLARVRPNIKIENLDV